MWAGCHATSWTNWVNLAVKLAIHFLEASKRCISRFFVELGNG